MKHLKSLVALGFAVAFSSNAFAETANPLAAVKESATAQTKQAATSAQNSAKAAVTDKVNAATNQVNSAKNAAAEKAAATTEKVKATAAEKASNVKNTVADKVAAGKEKAAAVKETATNKATQTTQTARETLNSAKTNASQTTEKVEKKAAKVGKINVNTADVQTLQALDGIGEVKAKAIVEYRQKHGPFKKAADLANVTGIGEATVEKLKSSISF